MNASSTEPSAATGPRPADARERALIARFRRCPMGPYDPELQAFLLPLRNLLAPGKHALMRLPRRNAWTLVCLGDRERPVQRLGGCFTSRAEAEWAVFRARWLALRGEDPEAIDG